MKRLVYLLLAAPLLLAACSDAGEQIGVEEDPYRTAEDRETADAQPGASAADHAGHDAGAESHEALPLRPIMQQLAADLAGFSYALWLEDYETMSQRSAAMADHTHISPEEIQRIESILGAEMAAFEEADEAVHESSIQLHEAAEARDLEGVLGRLHEVQTGCMTCHTQFRERLRTDNAGGAM